MLNVFLGVQCYN